jgi:hypothetical protein
VRAFAIQMFRERLSDGMLKPRIASISVSESVTQSSASLARKTTSGW